MSDKHDESLHRAIKGDSGVMFESSFLDHAREINLLDMWKMLWGNKWWIFSATFLSGILSIFYALGLPNFYKSEGTYFLASQEKGAGALASKFGGLAAIAGISFGGGDSNNLEQAIALVKSWSFSEYLVNKYDLKPLIIGLEKWDSENDKLIWNDKIYDPKRKVWLREPPPGKEPEPSSFETYRVLNKMIVVDNDVKKGLIKISVEHYSPKIARDWVSVIVTELNLHFQNRDMTEAKRNIEYLNKKISETNVSEMRAVFYQMIEEQTKTLMLAEVSDEYLLKTVIDPMVSEEKSRPKRALLVIFITMLGGLLSVIGVIAVSFLRKVKAISPNVEHASRVR